MSVDTQKKPHLRSVKDPMGRRYWAATFRGLVYFGKSPAGVMENIRYYYGDNLPCA